MKKQFKIFLFLAMTLIGTIITTTNMYAKTDKIKAGSYLPGPYYYMHKQGSRELWERPSWILFIFQQRAIII